jgi:hypothetical protein
MLGFPELVLLSNLKLGVTGSVFIAMQYWRVYVRKLIESFPVLTVNISHILFSAV